MMKKHNNLFIPDILITDRNVKPVVTFVYCTILELMFYSYMKEIPPKVLKDYCLIGKQSRLENILNQLNDLDLISFSKNFTHSNHFTYRFEIKKSKKFTIIPKSKLNKIQKYCDAPEKSLRIYLIYARYHNNMFGYSFPTYKQIRECVTIRDDDICAINAELEYIGLIRIQQDFSSAGQKFKNNRYRLVDYPL